VSFFEGKFKRKMKKELFITPSIVTFDSLDELIATVEEARELYRSAIDRYGDTLGGILRSPPPGTMSSPIPPLNNEEGGGKKGKGGSGGGKMSGGWMEIQELSIALNNPVAAHSQLLFKAAEELKIRLAKLDMIRKTLSEFPSRGYGSGYAYIVYFFEGIPENIVLIPSNKQTSRFRFATQFATQTLK
jgi:hypothetical protein